MCWRVTVRQRDLGKHGTTSSKRLRSEHPRQPARPAASAVGAAGPLLVRAAPPPSADAHLGESTTPGLDNILRRTAPAARAPHDDTAEAPLARARQPTGAPLLISLSPRDAVLRQHAQGEGDDAANREQPMCSTAPRPLAHTR